MFAGGVCGATQNYLNNLPYQNPYSSNFNYNKKEGYPQNAAYPPNPNSLVNSNKNRAVAPTTTGAVTTPNSSAGKNRLEVNP